MHFLLPLPPFHLLLDCCVTFLLLRLFDCTCQSPSFDDVEGINGETDLEEEREEEREEDLEDDDVDAVVFVRAVLIIFRSVFIVPCIS